MDIDTKLPWYLWLIVPYTYVTPFYRGVTVVLISKQFYDETIFVKSFLLRGPGWTANFLPKGNLVQVALHHELVSVDAQSLRDAVEARWRAFRDAPTVASTGTVAHGDATKPLSRWQWAQIAILLVGIGAALANIAGLWQLPGQSEARVTRMKARDESSHWKQMLKQSEQESREREAQSKQREKEMDEMMKRTFGD